ncbi:Protein-lysine N-methyltransferase efm5 [Tieghemiomyces parasiticus]|uniref:Protein-lysine N-methyltransferase efm5 n=1 Tax=Tieghemiomyces parasiticus TaxID=78921 RepID=A0A9W7ZYB3_9FUNG|nr:Protein-lysine N-methyltransferase efm5 [Tieghemiomyces parasiticus]
MASEQLLRLTRRGPGAVSTATRHHLRPVAGIMVRSITTDVLIPPHSAQPVVRQGLTGRSSVSGHVATVFGCTGFLGRYVVNRLGKKGTKVVTPYRCHEDSKRHLKLMGDLGQIVNFDYDVRNYDQLVAAVKHSDIVYNLVGRDYPTKNFSFEAVNVTAARDIAQACTDAGVPRLVHVSALGADAQSTSGFLRTKALGERAVREVFPDATIVRPGTLVGYESNLLNRIGFYRQFLPVVNHNRQILRPVDAADVALALDAMMLEPSTTGQTYELFSAKPYTYQDILDICSAAFRERVHAINVPKPIMKAVTAMLQYWYYPQLSPDEVERMFIDQVPTALNDPSIKTFADLGIQPRNFELTVLPYIRHFRRAALTDLGLDQEGARTFGKHHSS